MLFAVLTKVLTTKVFIVVFIIVSIAIIRIYLQNDHGSLVCREVPYEFM